MRKTRARPHQIGNGRGSALRNAVG